MVSIWIPPPAGFTKVNCDVATKKGSSIVAIAALCRDDMGRIVGGRASKGYANTVLQGEAMAARLAGTVLEELQISNAIIESDNKMLIQLCSTENVPPWECNTIIEDIRSFASTIDLSFSWVSRKFNRAAHWVATQFLNDVIPRDWMFNPPPQLLQICSLDAYSEAC